LTPGLRKFPPSICQPGRLATIANIRNTANRKIASGETKRIRSPAI